MYMNWVAARAVMAWTLVCLLVSVAGAAAQGNAEFDRDEAEVRAYRLSMPKIKQMADITLAFAKAMEGDAGIVARKKIERELEALEKKAEPTDADQKRIDALQAQLDALEAKDDDEPQPQTLADMAKRIEKEPRLATAIKAGGMTSREFATITIAFYQAMFAHMVQKGGALKELPKGVSQENVAFVRDNEVALTDLFRRLEAEDRNK